MSEIADAGSVTLHGTPAAPGVAVGYVRLVSHKDLDISSERIKDHETDSEMNRAEHVLRETEGHLTALMNSQKDREVRDILDAQIQILKDPELLNRIEALIRNENRYAEFALYNAFNDYIHLLRQTGQKWITDRIVDLQSLRDRLIYQIDGRSSPARNDEGSILFVDEISPTEMIEFSNAGISAVVMQHGGTTSHAAIIAQSLGIPCIVGANWLRSQLDGAEKAAVDATTGEIVLNPDSAVQKAYLKRRRKADDVLKESEKVSRMPGKTGCGTSFTIRANIEFKEELKAVERFHAEGVGLLRTETLFLRQGFFDKESHLQFYSEILEGTAEMPVTIRLLDIGGDKLPGKKLNEPNPFLGWRGMRMLLDEEELLRDQLEAVYRAAARFPGRVKLLLPMVSDPGELAEVRKKIKQLTDSLAEPVRKQVQTVPTGVMVEVPAIALQAEEAAANCDFFSIGSNDLTQYVMAADRGNERVSGLFQSAHPAVLKLIMRSIEAARKADIPVSVCGEMAARPSHAAALMGMGIRELSMNPASIPNVKKLLCDITLSECEELGNSLLKAAGREETENILSDWEKRFIK